MAFTSLFSSFPSEGLHVAHCAGDERENAGAAEAEIEHEGFGVAKEKKEKQSKRKKIDVSSRNGQQEEPKKRCRQRDSLQLIPAPSCGRGSDQERRPRKERRREWKMNYFTKFPQDGHCPLENSQRNGKREERDFACELDQYRRTKEAPPLPPFPFPSQQTGGSFQKMTKRKNIRAQQKPGDTRFHKKNQEKPGDSRFHKRNQEKPGPGQKGFAQLGKNWGHGRGTNGNKARAWPEEGKKKVYLGEEYLSRHTVEAQGRYICKYFLRGTCTRGDQCNFEHSHDIKKMELCKFYVQGFCTKDNCIYMHNEFPCKFFHTNTKCYKGDACCFSHEPLTDITRQLLDKVLNDEPLKQVEQELTVQEDCAPLPPVNQLTVDLLENMITVRSNFYSFPSATECQSQGSSILPQSGGGLSEKRTLPGVSPGLERGPHVHTHSPAVLAPEMERTPMEVQDEFISSAAQRHQGGPKPATSILKTLFLHLSPTHEGEKPQSSSAETGVAANQPGSDEEVNGRPTALRTEKKLAWGMVPGGQGAKMCDWLESKPSCSMLSTWDRNGDGDGEGSLRNEPVVVPLEAIPGLAGRDPRTPRRVTAIVLPLPPFAQTMKWSTEHLIPPPPPPQPDLFPHSTSSTPHSQCSLVGTPKLSFCSRAVPKTEPQVPSPAVHRLPVQALAGVIRPPYTDGKRAKPGRGNPVEVGSTSGETMGNVLKDLFKAFDPTASPFSE